MMKLLSRLFWLFGGMFAFMLLPIRMQERVVREVARLFRSACQGMPDGKP